MIWKGDYGAGKRDWPPRIDLKGEHGPNWVWGPMLQRVMDQKIASADPFESPFLG